MACLPKSVALSTWLPTIAPACHPSTLSFLYLDVCERLERVWLDEALAIVGFGKLDFLVPSFVSDVLDRDSSVNISDACKRFLDLRRAAGL